MASNFKKSGDVMTYTNGTGTAIASGAVVVIGTNVGIALGNIANGAVGEIGLCGVWEVPKTTSLAIAQGDILYWNTTTKKVTKTNTDVIMGTAFAAAVSAATTVEVKLYQ